MVLMMAGYDIDDDRHNELYAFNGLPDYYMMHPIPIYQNQLIRLYLLNMIEFDVARNVSSSCEYVSGLSHRKDSQTY
jgi:hypothetical protein